MTPLDVRAIPKVQLHCHLEGTIRPGTFRELAAKHRIDLGPRAQLPDERLYDFEDFRSFLLLFRDVSETLREPSDFARLASEYARDAATHNVRYAEIFISPSVWTWFQPKLDVRETVVEIREALERERRAGGPQVALICDLTRNFPDRAVATAKLAASLQDCGVIGIGLGGDEVNQPPAQFANVFAWARSEGLHCVAHAGEAAGAASVRDAVEKLGVERIGHGVRALEDDGTVELLVERNVTLEICPTSNFLTGACRRDEPHPLLELLARGVRCALDADDPTLFGTSVSREYGLAQRWLGDAATLRLARNAVEASFAPQPVRVALEAELDAFGEATGHVRAHPLR